MRDIPGQLVTVHMMFSILHLTSQSRPPFCGAGLSHFLVRDLKLAPHVWLHFPHASHCPKTPSIGASIIRQKIVDSCFAMCSLHQMNKIRLFDVMEYNFHHIPGHICSLHAIFSYWSPTHLSPPYLGAGLSQLLNLSWVPLPHGLSHSSDFQSPQFPWTVEYYIRLVNYYKSDLNLYIRGVSVCMNCKYLDAPRLSHNIFSFHLHLCCTYDILSPLDIPDLKNRILRLSRIFFLPPPYNNYPWKMDFALSTGILGFLEVDSLGADL